jgi:hypothetical protein
MGSAVLIAVDVAGSRFVLVIIRDEPFGFSDPLSFLKMPFISLNRGKKRDGYPGIRRPTSVSVSADDCQSQDELQRQMDMDCRRILD